MTRVIIISLVLLGLSACEATKGAGRDIQKAGDLIEDAASDIQKKF